MVEYHIYIYIYDTLSGFVVIVGAISGYTSLSSITPNVTFFIAGILHILICPGILQKILKLFEYNQFFNYIILATFL